MGSMIQRTGRSHVSYIVVTSPVLFDNDPVWVGTHIIAMHRGPSLLASQQVSTHWQLGRRNARRHCIIFQTAPTRHHLAARSCGVTTSSSQHRQVLPSAPAAYRPLLLQRRGCGFHCLSIGRLTLFKGHMQLCSEFISESPPSNSEVSCVQLDTFPT